MQQLLNTLYVFTPNAYLRLDNNTICVLVDSEKKMQVPLHHLNTVVCFGDVLLSAAIMQRCAEEGIALVLLDRHGRFKARLEGPVSGNVLLRQAQHRHQFTTESSINLEFAQSFLAGKIRNARQVLLRGARETDIESDKLALTRGSDALRHALQRIKIAKNMDQLRGFEGDAAKTYFSYLSFVIKPELREHFAMKERSRRPPLDRINALLSFLYAITMNDCRTALETVGLDPQLGFLHVVRPGRAALALDLMEEFRAPLAERLALTLINRGQIKTKDFISHEGGAIYLNDEGRKTVVLAYQSRKKEEITHPLTEQKMPLGLVPLIQARLLARAIRGEMQGYMPFLTR